MTKVLDANGDGRVSYEDFEAKCIKYLCEGVSLGSSPSRGSLHNYSTNEVKTSAFHNTDSQQNQVFSKYANLNQNPNYSSNHEVKQEISHNSYNSPQQTQQFSSSANQRVETRVESNQVYQEEHRNEVNSSQQQNNSSVNNVSQSVNQSLSNTEQREYNSQVKECLQMTYDIFSKYALQDSFTITANEVPGVLEETYSALGRQGYRPTEDDVAVWMKLCDGNEDGHVEYE